MTIPKTAPSAGMRLDAALTARLSNAQRSYAIQCGLYQKEYSGNCRERNKEIRDLRRDLTKLSVNTGCEGNGVTSGRCTRPTTAPATMRAGNTLYQSGGLGVRPLTATNPIPLRKNINLSVRAGGTQTDAPSPTVLEARRLYQRRQLAKARRAANRKCKPMIKKKYERPEGVNPVLQRTISSIRTESRASSPNTTNSPIDSPKLPRRPPSLQPTIYRSHLGTDSSQMYSLSNDNAVEAWVHTGRYHDSKTFSPARHSTPARSKSPTNTRWLTVPQHQVDRNIATSSPTIGESESTDKEPSDEVGQFVLTSYDKPGPSTTAGIDNTETTGLTHIPVEQQCDSHHSDCNSGLYDDAVPSEGSEENVHLTPTAIVFKHEETDKMQVLPSFSAPRRPSRVSFNDEVTVTSFCDVDSDVSNLSDLMCDPPGYYQEQRRGQFENGRYRKPGRLATEAARQCRRYSSPDIRTFAAQSILKKAENNATEKNPNGFSKARAGWDLIRDKFAHRRRHSVSDVSQIHGPVEDKPQPGPVRLVKSWQGLRTITKTMGVMKSEMHEVIADLEIKAIPDVGMTSVLNDLNAAVGNQPSRDRRRSMSSGTFQPRDSPESAPKAALQQLLQKQSGRRPSATEMRMFERRPSMRLLRMMNAQNQSRSTAEMMEMQRNREVIAAPIEET